SGGEEYLRETANLLHAAGGLHADGDAARRGLAAPVALDVLPLVGLLAHRAAIDVRPVIVGEALHLGAGAAAGEGRLIGAVGRVVADEDQRAHVGRAGREALGIRDRHL